MARITPSLPLVASLLAVAGAALAQVQPAAATNAQDEVVNIVKGVAPETTDLTIFRTGDKAERNDYVSAVMELQHAVALEILPNVLDAVELEKGSARSLRYTDPATGEERYFLQVVTTQSQMPSVLETIKALDLPGVVSSSGDMKYHVRMEHRRASEVAEILAATTLSGEGEVTFDDRTNTIYFSDSVSDGLRNVEVIKFYDATPPQVEFELVAVELDEDDAGRLGLDWDAWKDALGGQVEFTGNVFEGGDTFGRLDALLTVDATALASFLNYTVTTGTGKVATRTTLTGSNDRPAVYSSLRRLTSSGYTVLYTDPEELLEEVPGVNARETLRGSDPVGERPVVIVPPSRSRATRTSLSPMAPGASALDPSRNPGEKAEGMFLLIEPVIGRSMMTADIRFVLNSQVGEDRFGDPIISERLVDTNVALRDGQPFSLGGLDRETTVRVRSGIPGLKDTPVLRHLFSVENTREAKSRVYLVITPRLRSQQGYAAAFLNSSRLEVEPAYTDEAARILQALPAEVAPLVE